MKSEREFGLSEREHHAIVRGREFMRLLFAGALALAVTGCSPKPENSVAVAQAKVPATKTQSATAGNIVKTDEEWKKQLTPDQYRITRQKGTERAFTGKYWNTFDKGVYKCVCCGQELFLSDTKFESGCGWPSYSAPAAESAVKTQDDHTPGMDRTEVMCSRCGAHLGHVFDDGHKPTGLRYCINSGSLEFDQQKPQEAAKSNSAGNSKSQAPNSK